MTRTPDLRRWCQIHGVREEKDLAVGMDFRSPQYRREVFLRFYQFHLENASHPGAVYYAIPWLVKRHKLTVEDKFWLAFINGNTQNIVTTWIIFQRFPDAWRGVGLKQLAAWFDENYGKLAWDTDRRYHKKDFIKAVHKYVELVGGSQKAYFQDKRGKTEAETFQNLWKALREDFYTFGRLSSFSYSEYLRIIGYEMDCDTLFLSDLSGSKSHRNGLAKVLGRDDLDWHDSGTFRGDYAEGEISWLEEEGARLIQDARVRLKGNAKVDPRAVGYFTLESALCTYKSWHRKNRRYPNCYNDMFNERIRLAETRWGFPEVKQFWECRKECTPTHLLLEKCFHDPGLCPEKQNHYRETGQVIMMSKRWPEFDNPFDRRIWG